MTINILFIVKQLRSEVNKILENARVGKLIGSSLEAKVYLHSSDAGVASRLQELCLAENEADALHRIFITSQVAVLDSLNADLSSRMPHTGKYSDPRSEIWIGVARADGSKCERCWNFTPQVGSFPEHPTLCARCYDVINVHPLPAAAGVS